MTKARRRRNFDNICHSRKHTINEILNEIEIQEQRKHVAGEIFYNICHSRTQIMNEILNEIEIHEWWKSEQAKCFNRICQSHTKN